MRACIARRSRELAPDFAVPTLDALVAEGIFIVGSGMTFHNLRAFRDPATRQALSAEAVEGTVAQVTDRIRLPGGGASADRSPGQV